MDTEELKQLASKLPTTYTLVFNDASQMLSVKNARKLTIKSWPLERVDKWRDPPSTLAHATRHAERVRGMKKQ